MQKTIFLADKNYTFSDFFDMAYPTEDIIKEFGYEYSFEMLELPRQKIEETSITELQNELIKKLPKISLNSEIARRDFLIAPILFKLLNFVDFRISTEYPLDVEKNLRGTLDYLLRSNKKLTIIEAKRGDLDKGFTQLAVELIAMEKYEEETPEPLFGIVTTGDIWKFGKLESTSKKITKDINAYRIPTDMIDLFSILVGILA